MKKGSCDVWIRGGRKMKRSIWRQFVKSKICMLSTIICFVVTWGFASYLGILGETGFALLHIFSRYNFYVCFFLVCISYYYISSANRNFVKEASDVSGKSSIFERTAVALVLLILLIWNIGMVLVLVFSSIKNDGTTYFLTWFPVSYLCNVFLPQIIVVFMTFLVSASWHPNRWMMLEIFFLFMISPISEIIVWMEKPMIPIDVVWNKLKWHFNILYQNGEWSPNYQYGLQTEKVRIYLIGFWICFLLTLMFTSILKKKRYSIVVGIVTCIFLLLSEQPASLYRMNMKWNGANQESQRYFQEDNCTYQSEKTQDFRIVKYDLGLDFNHMLSVVGDLEIQADSEKDEFVFTLYRGYKIKKIESKTQDISVKYKQDKDLFYVYTSQKTNNLELKIQYSGYHPRFYSNSNASMLPGWFAWYPMSGQKQLYLLYPEYGNMHGYNPYNRIESAKIRLTSKKPLITNLEKVNRTCYEGTADSITVLNGLLTKAEDNIICNYLPLYLHSDLSVEQFLDEQKTEYKKSLNVLEKQYGIDVEFLKNKKIIFASKDMGRNLANNWISVFDQYILAAPGYLSEDGIFRYLVLKEDKYRQMREDSPIIQCLLMHMGLCDSLKETSENLNDAIQWEIECRADSGDDADNLQKLQLVQEVLGKVDKEQFVKEAVKYILNPSEYENDDAFMNAMREKL